ncbi:serine/threonine-protein kinase 31-like [Polyodon spathula]|uniref:serine/threonine-protein kinase 31-like n=1 Tax=Polyodon spathula TaxID=7913 RepID=UPI001B7DBB3F|nr:serine/threonine-protein kinase 31-like [Polyodon spathula]
MGRWECRQANCRLQPQAEERAEATVERHLGYQGERSRRPGDLLCLVVRHGILGRESAVMVEAVPGKVQLIVGTHTEDAVTFWAQVIDRDELILDLTSSLAKTCPQAKGVYGTPSSQKIYGGLFSEDKCWYRCSVQWHEDEEFRVTYVDYGNSEIVNRSALVELPEKFQFPGLARRYKLWAIHIPADGEKANTEQGKAYLHNVVYEKQIKILIRGTSKDSTTLVQVLQGDMDIGDEIARMGFAIKGDPAHSDEVRRLSRILRSPSILWARRTLDGGSRGDKVLQQGIRPKLRPVFPDQIPPDVRERSTTYQLQTENLLRKKIAKIPGEIEKLDAETCTAVQNSVLLESQLNELKLELQKVKEESQQRLEVRKCTETPVGSKLKGLAEKVEVLRTLRQSSSMCSLGDDLLEAIGVVTQDCISPPETMEKLTTAWTKYSQAQEMLQSCKNEGELEQLIARRNEVREAFSAAVDEYLLEVDGLSITERMKTLEELGSVLSSVFGSFTVENVGEDAFEQFCDWKNNKQDEFSGVRNETDNSLKSLGMWFSSIKECFSLKSEASLSSSDIDCNVDALLEKVEKSVNKELEVSLEEQDDEDCKIVSNAFSKVMQKIHQEQKLLCTVQEKYIENTQFKKEMHQWQNGTPKVDALFSIQKAIKTLKSQLRWKLVEKSSLEESDEPDDAAIQKKTDEITETRNSIFQEVCREKEDYERLGILVKKWFPELPLLYPEARISQYNDSEGLVTNSLERDLFDARPMRELSGKRPLVHTEFQGQEVILKGYSVDAATEAKVLERATQYHKAWSGSKEHCGLLPVLFLFFGKFDPLVYVMVPYCPFGSLRTVQATHPFTASEVPKVMKGVAAGLQTLHSSSITHGSLHPNNVFVLNREQGVIGDFDFTKTADQRSSTTWMVAGNISLAAPELKDRQTTSPSSDMYAYGCLLLWLNFPNHKFKMKADGVPDTGELDMDPDLRSLLSKLLTYKGRLVSAEVLAEGYFLHADAVAEAECTDTMKPGDSHTEASQDC